MQPQRMLICSYHHFYVFIWSSSYLFIRSSGFGLLDQLGSSLNWSFLCYSCGFCSTGVYSKYCIFLGQQQAALFITPYIWNKLQWNKNDIKSTRIPNGDHFGLSIWPGNQNIYTGLSYVWQMSRQRLVSLDFHLLPT